MIKIGVAVSVYNKGHFVATNLNVFEHVWKTVNPHVAVCCNDPITREKLKKYKRINTLVEGEDYPATNKHMLRLRQYDCIKKSVTAASKGTDYVIHWHADAFALNDKSVFYIAEYMQKKDILFAARGLWKDCINPKIPDGDIDDHFFIIKSSHVSKVYEETPEALTYVIGLTQAGICSEGILSHLVQKVTPQEKIHIYSDMRECNVFDNKRVDNRYPDGIAHRTLPPVNLDPHRGFLHCDDLVALERLFKQHGIDHNLIVKELV